MSEGLSALLLVEGLENGSVLFESCPPAVVERRGLVCFRDKIPPENKTSSAIFHTSGRPLEADRDEQDACVL